MGHLSRDCPKTTPVCYNCNQTGHISRDCTQPRAEKSCYKCGETGHISRDCTQSNARGGGGGGGGGGSSSECYKCGKVGHISRNCPDGGYGGGWNNSGEQSGKVPYAFNSRPATPAAHLAISLGIAHKVTNATTAVSLATSRATAARRQDKCVMHAAKKGTSPGTAQARRRRKCVNKQCLVRLPFLCESRCISGQ